MSRRRSNAVDDVAGRGVEDDDVREVVAAAELARAGGGSDRSATEHEVRVVVIRVGGPELAAQMFLLRLDMW